ncbi:methyltransferase [Leucobacter sp. UT-8R-CII-1-4]|uniref:class I SAM-dependent methyltransferase n=1 Tax=Leucobacter sp. UT-8R-CII-1-4 TaxID=3040075 RepID=UPI0024A94874|nr:methyltransferase [Leucobacter sp. UT-8R-CII-1-4]MDI6022939.1 methyltransferase [Leucobacter sp. UT-8R-CII-1-4]
MSDHYFSETPSSDFTPREIEAILAGDSYKLLTAGGVFSPEHLDRGTEILLRTLEVREPAENEAAKLPVLDLGCGWGPIALSAALHESDREVWAVDVNARSRELTALNAERLGLKNVRVGSPEEVPSDIVFGAIHSNPPIRVGKQVLHEMLQLWLPRLAHGGEALLVVAKHLGADSLQKWIDTEFAELEVNRIARDKGFHVIEAYRA